MPCIYLSPNELNNPYLSAFNSDPEPFRGKVFYSYTVFHYIIFIIRKTVCSLTVPDNFFPIFNHTFNLEIFEVIHCNNICMVTRLNGTQVISHKYPCWIYRYHADRHYRVHSKTDSLAEDVIQMTPVQQVPGMCVICNKHTPPVCRCIYNRKQGLHIPCNRPFTYHQIHAKP